jgi:hypothetical protein
MVAEIPSKGDAPIMLDFNASAAPNTNHATINSAMSNV